MRAPPAPPIASVSAAPRASGPAVVWADANGNCPKGYEYTIGESCNRPCKVQADCGDPPYRCAPFESLGGKRFCEGPNVGDPPGAR